jgi:hypothetical protein
MPEAAAAEVPIVPLHKVKLSCLLTQILAPTERVPIAGGGALSAHAWCRAEVARLLGKGVPAVLATSPSGRVAVAKLKQGSRKHVTDPMHA